MFDSKYSALHKEVYWRRFDELDTVITRRIMEDPACEEAVLLNKRVQAEVEARLQEDQISALQA